MHQYRVRYIAREGAIVTRLILAKSGVDAKRVAEAEGCEDILSVKREIQVHFPILSLIAAIAILVALAVISRII